LRTEDLEQDLGLLRSRIWSSRLRRSKTICSRFTWLGQGRSAAERQYGQDLLNIGGTRGELQRQLAGDISGVGTGIAGIGANLAGYGSSLGQLGETQQRLRGQDISMLEGLGATDRGIEEQRLARQYNQQFEQRQSPLLAAQFVQGFAPQYQASQTQVTKDLRHAC
jgi:hypothetical protein